MSVHIAIPVLIDSPERKRNMKNLLAHLAGSHVGLVTVVEQFCDEPAVANEDADYRSLYKPNDYFYRAELLNLVFRECKDDVIVIHDADAVLKPESVEWALKEVGEGRLDLAIPHNQKVKDADPTGYAGGDLYVFLSGRAKNWLCSNSCGLCQVMSRKAWRQAGMENENIVSWGSDDRERLARWKRLGLRVGFCSAGDGLHQRHPDSKFSRTQHGRFNQNRREYMLTLRQGSEELRQRIAGWPWTKL